MVMQKPKAVTNEEQWFAYIAGLLEEIRDSVKPVEEIKIIDNEVLHPIPLPQPQKNGSAKRGGKRGKNV
jgi:hypothetical protein